MKHLHSSPMTIAPGESLCSDAEMVIGDEWRCFMLRPVTHAKSVDVSEDADGDGNKEECLLPHLPTIRVVTSRHLAHLAHAGGLGLLEELDVGPGEGGHDEAGAVFTD